MAQFYTLLTTIGAAQIANAQALGQTVNLTEMAVGDGNGAYANPTESAAALTHEVWRGAINQISVDATNPGWLIIEAVVPANIGGWTVREVGVFDAANNLIAVGQFPETYKPLLAQGSGKDLYIRAILEISSNAAVTLKIDPAVVLATRAYVDGRTIKWLPVQTADYTASAQEGVPFDNALAAHTLTLPATPAYGEEIWWHDVSGTFKLFPLTILRNGNLLMGLAADSSCSTNNIKAGVKYYGATIGWRFIL